MTSYYFMPLSGKPKATPYGPVENRNFVLAVTARRPSVASVRLARANARAYGETAMSSATMEASRPSPAESAEYHRTREFVQASDSLSCAHCSEPMTLVAKVEHFATCLFVFQCQRCDHVETKDKPLA